MPEPVGTSTNRSREQRSSEELDLEYGENGAACVAESRSDAPPARESRQAPTSSEPVTEAARELMKRATRRKLLGPAPSTDTSAQRRAAMPVTPLYGSAEVTSSKDAAYVEGALVKGTKSEAQVELAGASMQRGLQNEDTVTFAQLQISSRNGRHSVNTEFGTAKASSGVHSPDGSTGVNLSAQVNLAQFEYTYTRGKNSATFGASVGVSVEASFGVRERNGRIETCQRIGFDDFTLGTCVEETSAPAPAGAEGASSTDAPRATGSGGTSGSGS